MEYRLVCNKKYRGFGKKKARERLSDFLVLGLLTAAVAEAIARVRSRDSHDRLL